MPDKAIFIVRACNCHEDLLKVARVAISWYEHPAVQAAFLKDEVLCGRLNEAIVLARAAIRKAENGVNHVVDY